MAFNEYNQCLSPTLSSVNEALIRVVYPFSIKLSKVGIICDVGIPTIYAFLYDDLVQLIWIMMIEKSLQKQNSLKHCTYGKITSQVIYHHYKGTHKSV